MSAFHLLFVIILLNLITISSASAVQNNIGRGETTDEQQFLFNIPVTSFVSKFLFVSSRLVLVLVLINIKKSSSAVALEKAQPIRGCGGGEHQHEQQLVVDTLSSSVVRHSLDVNWPSVDHLVDKTFENFKKSTINNFVWPF